MPLRLACSLLLPLLALGCSALVNPDETELGGSDMDSGPGTTDAGPPVDGGDFDAGPVGEDAGPGGGCSGDDTCTGGVFSFCEDDRRQTEDCPLGCSTTGEVRCAFMVPSNVSPDFWLEDARDVEVETTLAFDTSSCRATSASSEVTGQLDGGPDVCVLSVADMRIRPGATLQVVGPRPVVIMATGIVRIEGTIDVGADLDEPGPGGFGGGVRASIDGMGPSGGAGGEHVGSFDDGGGAGGGLCGAGGDGGQGGRAVGGGGGGAVSPAWQLSPLAGGSGGGRGRGSFFSTGATNAGLGGGGGGALQISALEGILLTGQIRAGGGGGLSGKNLVVGSGNWGSGGGGGSGGAVLLEAPEISVGGAGNIRGAGGGGGGSASSSGNGQDGRNGNTAESGRARGGNAADAAVGADGGRSGGGTNLVGQDGLPNARVPSGNGGGGGGGSGCILFRTADGTPSTDGIINPSVAPGYRTLTVRRD